MDGYTFHYALYGLYIFVLLMVCVYGLHRYHLVYLYYKHGRNIPSVKERFDELPQVTVQLPMYNERYVAERIIEGTCAIDYPRDRLQIQVLDDSTDDTVEIARAVVERMRRRGHDVVYIHRANRKGFKAGALEAGLGSATGEFVCIFDADFLPRADILHKTIHYFTDERVGMVQARWEHINRDHSLLTKTQAILLDGHFVMEHGARSRSGRFMSFNGTAGIWRKACIMDAGGWEHDTLTEDLDLSYRAQMKGWKFLFLPSIAAPAELPPEMGAFKAQQHRWAKGGAQTCRKLLPKILESRLPRKIKVEAFFHLTSCTVYLYMVAVTGLLLPVLLLRWGGDSQHVTFTTYLIDASLFIVATCSASSFYICSQRELSRTWADSVKYLPFLMALGVGICLNNAIATLQGFFGKPGEFVRTPKFGVAGSGENTWRMRNTYTCRRKLQWLPYVELVMGINMFICLLLCIQRGWITIGAFFMALFTVGFLYVSLTTLLGRRLAIAQPERRPRLTEGAAATATVSMSEES